MTWPMMGLFEQTCSSMFMPPLILLAKMIGKIKLNSQLIIYNCFYPLIKCHLPATFHFRYSFAQFCSLCWG